MSTLRILWISAGRVVLEDDDEGARLDVLLQELASDEKMIARLRPIDAFRVGYQAALLPAKRP
ncbi:MAG TPA: hypothetical protein VN598_12565 [Usitatibacter sp.]|nr:hypothetical protein [Usitatibacter sp.]